MRMWKLPVLPAVLAAGAIALAGCGSSGSSSAAKPAAKPVAKSPTATTVPTNVANDTAQRKYVAIGSCASAAGGWGASGTATNPGKAPVTYSITVFFTSSKATVEGYGVTKVTVPAGDKTMPWKVTAAIAKPDAQSRCVLRGVS